MQSFKLFLYCRMTANVTFVDLARSLKPAKKGMVYELRQWLLQIRRLLKVTYYIAAFPLTVIV